MKQLFLYSFIIMLLASCHANAQTGNAIPAQEFSTAITGQNIQLLDVRTASEYQGGHIAHAMQADWKNQLEFMDRTQHLDKSRPVYVYCQSGKRSAMAAEWMRSNGYAQVTELNGGMIAWKQADLPVEGSDNTPQMTKSEFLSLVGNSGTILVDFGAEWCPPCKKMIPVTDSLKAELTGKFKMINIDGGIHTNLIKELNISGIPAFVIYKNGQETWRTQGIVEKATLTKELQ